MKTFEQIITEAPFPGNIGFEEMVKFYQNADKKQITEMEKIIKNNDWEGFKKQIKKVLGVKLK
jgi:enolase